MPYRLNNKNVSFYGFSADQAYILDGDGNKHPFPSLQETLLKPNALDEQTSITYTVPSISWSLKLDPMGANQISHLFGMDTYAVRGRLNAHTTFAENVCVAAMLTEDRRWHVSHKETATSGLDDTIEDAVRNWTERVVGAINELLANLTNLTPSHMPMLESLLALFVIEE